MSTTGQEHESAAHNTSKVTTEPPHDAPIQRGTRCLDCHYSLAGVRLGPCPECGLPIGPEEVERWAAREAWISRFRLPRWYLASVVIPVAYAIGAGIYAGDKRPAIMTLIVLGLTSAGTVATSEVLGLLGRPNDRSLARRVWLRYAYLVHLPWLVCAACALIALIIAGIERLAGTDGDALVMVSFLGLFAWAFGSVASLVLFIAIMANADHRHTLRWSRAQIAVITLAVLFQFPFNAAIGFAGGMVAGTGALRLMGIEIFPEFD